MCLLKPNCVHDSFRRDILFNYFYYYYYLLLFITVPILYFCYDNESSLTRSHLCSNCKLSEITILRRYPPEYINAVHSRTRNRLLKFQPADKKRKEFDNTTSPPKRNCIENVSSFPSKSESMAC